CRGRHEGTGYRLQGTGANPCNLSPVTCNLGRQSMLGLASARAAMKPSGSSRLSHRLPTLIGRPEKRPLAGGSMVRWTMPYGEPFTIQPRIMSVWTPTENQALGEWRAWTIERRGTVARNQNQPILTWRTSSSMAMREANGWAPARYMIGNRGAQ